MSDVGFCTFSYVDFEPTSVTQTGENIAITVQQETKSGVCFVDTDEGV